MPAGNHGRCFHLNKYSVQDYEYNYHESLQAHLIEVNPNGHCSLRQFLPSIPLPFPHSILLETLQDVKLYMLLLQGE